MKNLIGYFKSVAVEYNYGTLTGMSIALVIDVAINELNEVIER